MSLGSRFEKSRSPAREWCESESSEKVKLVVKVACVGSELEDSDVEGDMALYGYVQNKTDQ